MPRAPLLRAFAAFALLAACSDAPSTLAPRVAADASPGPLTPYVTGDFFHTYTPPGTRYLNDHTLAQSADGTWHVIGITDTTLGTPQDEHIFLHATAPSLYGPWTDEPDALAADPALNERVLWAPFVFTDAPTVWTMIYWGDWITPDMPANGIRRASSPDLSTWSRIETTSTPSMRPPGGRDPMLLHDGTHWLLYSVGVDPDSRGQITVSITSDLDDPAQWTEPDAVITDPVPSYDWGNLESPFVVRIDAWYYLFLTRTGDDDGDYFRTMVFRSTDPTSFVWSPLTEIHAHAAEIVQDGRDWYITSAGWTSEVGEANRGLLVARLAWAADGN